MNFEKLVNYFTLYLNKKICNYTYIFTKCNDIFKFSISLKFIVVKTFLAVPSKTGLFYIALFIYS